MKEDVKVSAIRSARRCSEDIVGEGDDAQPGMADGGHDPRILRQHHHIGP